ncbi:hypothetical protein RND81_12G027700 [Saponaria officinalis]|uniref:Pterin-binding domain-containing protein n=1 Tax=Saponaria officinalis TaxID=3572 RepID=A0AAW1H2M7_SAPOF
MRFGSNTVIQPIDTTSTVVLPEYQNLAQIPKTVSGEEKFDVLGVIIYIEDSPRKIITSPNCESYVRELLIVDNSVNQPVIISAWNDLAETACDTLARAAQTYNVVGFTAMRVSSYKCFSLATSMSTTFDKNSAGNRANNLREWAQKKHNVLANMNSRTADVKNTPTEKLIKTIYTLLQKKVQNTLQEERHWLRVTVPDPDFNKINAYIGCSKCGKRTNIPAGQPYKCNACSKDCVSCPRITFTCDVADGTGIFKITTFTEDAEKLFRLSAPELFQIKHSDDRKTFQLIQKKLNESPILIQVGLKATLSRNNVLQWVLRTVKIDENSDNDPITNTLTGKTPEGHTTSSTRETGDDTTNNSVVGEVEPASDDTINNNVLGEVESALDKLSELPPNSTSGVQVLNIKSEKSNEPPSSQKT